MDGLKPYPAYRDSDVPWLGQVPAHWEVVKLKTVAARTQNGSTPPTDSPHYYSDEGLPWFGPSSLGASLTMGRPTRYVSDLAIRDGKVRPIVPPALAVSVIGNVGRSALMVEPGTTNQQITCFELLEQRVNARFVGYQFRLVESALAAGASSATIAILDASELRSTRLAIPATMAEQEAIVRFLDHYDRRAWRYVAAKKKLIALLNEEKQATINRAVTRGLGPNVRLNPSGIDWLGDVPETWEVMPIGRFSRVGNGSTPSRGNAAYWQGGTYPWLNSSQVNRGCITDADQFVTEAALRECHLPRVAPDSVLIAITGQGKTRGTAAILAIEATINQHLAYITSRDARISSKYLQLALTGAYGQLRAISDDSGSTKGALTCEDLKRFRLPIPPLCEQLAIVHRVREDCRRIEAAMSRTEREMGLVHEYRTRLIADVVTGKLDVREAAANLPDEPDENAEDIEGAAEPGEEEPGLSPEGGEAEEGDG